MARKKYRNIKTIVKRAYWFTFESIEVFDQTRFYVLQNAQKIDAKHRSIWGERQVSLDELDHSIHINLEIRGWLSLCHDLIPPMD